MILDLLLINLIMVMIFNSGFVDEVDNAISRRFKFHHLPKPFIFTGNFNLLGITLALASATLTSVTTPLLRTIENYILKIIELMNRIL